MRLSLRWHADVIRRPAAMAELPPHRFQPQRPKHGRNEQRQARHVIGMSAKTTLGSVLRPNVISRERKATRTV